jgi:hypothetical protein
MRAKRLLILPALLSFAFATSCGKKSDDDKNPGSTAQTPEPQAEPEKRPATVKPAARSPYARAPGSLTKKVELSKEDAALAEKALAYSEALAAAVDANAEDCDKMADAVKKVVDANLELFPKMRAKKDSELRRVFETRNKVRLTQLKKKIEPLRTCLGKSKKLAEAYAPAMIDK